MHASLPRPVAAVIWLVAAGLPALLAFTATRLPLDFFTDGWAIYTYTFITSSWCLVGAFLATRRPENGVGWTVFAIGALCSLALLGQGWANLGRALFGPDAPGAVAGAMLGVLFNTGLVLAVTVLPLIFPEGRLLSRRWVVVLVTALGSAALLTLATIVTPGQIEGVEGIENPWGITALGDLPHTLASASSTVGLLTTPLCVAAAVLRFRRGSPVERAQLKWFGATAGLAALAIVLATVLPQPFGVLAFVGFTIALGLVPISIGIAVLRYRLYEIDRLVGRTVSYAVVTAILAAAFVGTNLALQAVLADVTGSSTLTTTAATLVVAALFQPLRRRVQGAVDRRFNRRRADADRVVGRFSASVREHVDLDSLRAAIASSVNDAVAPTGMSIWLRGHE